MAAILALGAVFAAAVAAGFALVFVVDAVSRVFGGISWDDDL